MVSPWYLVLDGDGNALRRLQDLARGSAEYSVDEEGGEWHLRSASIDGAAGPEDARSSLIDLLVRLADVAAAAAYVRVHMSPGGLGRTNESGGSDVWVFPEPARVRVRALPPTVIAGGVAPEPLDSKLLRLGAANAHLRLAIHFLNADLSWFNLWKAYEPIKDANGGEARLVANGWATDADLKRFRRTANTYAAVGDKARHAKLRVPAPLNPMALEQAEDYVRALLLRWVNSLTCAGVLPQKALVGSAPRTCLRARSATRHGRDRSAHR